MKKSVFAFIIMLLTFCMIGCSMDNPKYINISSKPNNHYYTDKLYKKLLSNENFTIYVFDTNLYKEIEVPEEDKNIIEDFVKSLIEDNYSDTEITENEPFKLKIVFEDEKFLIKVFNSDTVSIASWDGSYKPDVISMSTLPLGYNLYDFCNHIKNKLNLE